MDKTVNEYADAIYQKLVAQSAGIVRSEKINFVLQMASRAGSHHPIGSPELQAIAGIYSRGIERCIQARFDSYHEAYDQAKLIPSRSDLAEILNNVNAVQDQETRQAAATLQQFAIANSIATGADAGIDAEGILGSCLGEVHDRVVHDWKAWKETIHVEAKAARESEGLIQPPKIGWRHVLQFLFGWPAVGGAAAVLFGFAGNAIYAGDVIATFVLCLAGLALLTTKFAVWDRTKNLPYRYAVNAAIIALAVIALLVVTRLAKKRGLAIERDQPQPGEIELLSQRQLDLAKDIQSKYEKLEAAYATASKYSELENGFGDVSRETEVLLTLDPHSGYGRYFRGEIMRFQVRAKLLPYRPTGCVPFPASSIDDFYDYIDTEANLSRTDSSLAREKDCFRRATGFCAERTAYVNHLLAYYHYKLAIEKSDRDEKIRLLISAKTYADAALYPESKGIGFTQCLPTLTIRSQIEQEFHGLMNHGSGH